MAGLLAPKSSPPIPSPRSEWILWVTPWIQWRDRVVSQLPEPNFPIMQLSRCHHIGYAVVVYIILLHLAISCPPLGNTKGTTFGGILLGIPRLHRCPEKVHRNKKRSTEKKRAHQALWRSSAARAQQVVARRHFRPYSPAPFLLLLHRPTSGAGRKGHFDLGHRQLRTRIRTAEELAGRGNYG